MRWSWLLELTGIPAGEPEVKTTSENPAAAAAAAAAGVLEEVGVPGDVYPVNCGCCCCCECGLPAWGTCVWCLIEPEFLQANPKSMSLPEDEGCHRCCQGSPGWACLSWAPPWPRPLEFEFVAPPIFAADLDPLDGEVEVLSTLCCKAHCHMDCWWS